MSPAAGRSAPPLADQIRPAQLGLDLGLPATYRLDDFLPAFGNAAALAWLRRWPVWPGPALVLHGPPGCGKTHLARLFAERTAARILAADAVPAVVEAAGWLARPVHVVEHADRTPSERALLHLYNGTREAGGYLLLTSRWPIAAWPLTLADLASRLRAAPSAAIDPPDDGLLAAVLIKLFADRQVRVDHAVVTYLVARMERSFAEAGRLVDALDAASLRARRPVTLALAREVLDIAPAEGRDAASG